MKLFKNFKTKKQLRKEIQLLQIKNQMLLNENVLKDVKQRDVLKIVFSARFFSDNSDAFIERICRSELSKELKKYMQVTISTDLDGNKSGEAVLCIVVDKEA